jgi:NADPH-dependent 2,4-dienoyl-CoA reductase/sulfur reductase-like enzyme
VVDDHQRTSQPGVWAAGDCCTSTHLVTGQQVHMALGTYANRQARVAGIKSAVRSTTRARSPCP